MCFPDYLNLPAVASTVRLTVADEDPIRLPTVHLYLPASPRVVLQISKVPFLKIRPASVNCSTLVFILEVGKVPPSFLQVTNGGGTPYPTQVSLAVLPATTAASLAGRTATWALI